MSTSELSCLAHAQFGRKSVEEICQELTSEVAKVRDGKDEEFKKNMQLVAALPTFVLTIISKFVGFISGDLGLGISAIGLKPRNFGSCLVTNVGVFGVEEAVGSLAVALLTMASTPLSLPSQRFRCWCWLGR